MYIWKLGSGGGACNYNFECGILAGDCATLREGCTSLSGSCLHNVCVCVENFYSCTNCAEKAILTQRATNVTDYYYSTLYPLLNTNNGASFDVCSGKKSIGSAVIVAVFLTIFVVLYI